MKRLKTLKDHVYDHIADQIRIGELRPGQKINENIICQELGISRTPVREALIQLAAEGVLNNTARKGFVIKSMSREDVREIYQLIGLLDGYAAKLAGDLLTESDLSDMGFHIGAMDLAIRSGNYPMYHDQQTAFHQVYIDKCKNQTLINAVSGAKNKLLKRSYTDSDDTRLKEVFLDTNEEHKEILELFKKKDKEEHKEILELFKKKDKDGLFKYLSEVHWAPTYMEYDMLVVLPEE